MEYCEEKDCSECCLRPKILLLNDDVNKITSIGYYDVYFTDEAEGIKALRTKDDGSCVFYKPDTMQCEIRNSMPVGCTLRPYTISYLTNEPMIELYENCRFYETFKNDTALQKRADDFLQTLKKEIEWRRKTGYF